MWRGAAKIYELVAPSVKTADPALAARLDQQFAALTALLDSHKKGDGYQLYQELKPTEVKALSAAVDGSPNHFLNWENCIRVRSDQNCDRQEILFQERASAFRSRSRGGFGHRRERLVPLGPAARPGTVLWPAPVGDRHTEGRSSPLWRPST